MLHGEHLEIMAGILEAVPVNDLNVSLLFNSDFESVIKAITKKKH